MGLTKFDCDPADNWAEYDFIENNVYGNWKLCVLYTICLSLEWSDNWSSPNVMCDRIFTALWRVVAMWIYFKYIYSIRAALPSLFLLYNLAFYFAEQLMANVYNEFLYLFESSVECTVCTETVCVFFLLSHCEWIVCVFAVQFVLFSCI